MPIRESELRRVLAAVLGAVCAATAGAASAKAQEPEWILREDLRIGAADGPQALSRIGELAVHPSSGRIYVTQPMEQTIRVFSRTGALLKVIGRRGSGPGEFQGGLSRVGFRADSLYAVDAANQRLTMFSLDGKLYYSHRLAAAPVEPRGGRPLPIGFLHTGRIVAKPQSTRQHEPDLTLPILLYERDGRLLGTFRRVHEGGRGGRIRFEKSMTVFLQTLPASTLVAMDHAGTSVVFVDRRTEVQEPDGAVFRVVRMRAPGDTVYSRAFRYTPSPVPHAFIDSVRNVWTERFMDSGQPSCHAAAGFARDSVKLPPYEPPISGVAVSVDGEVWLRREEVGRTEVEYLVLSAEGTIKARVKIPQAVVIRRVIDDYARMALVMTNWRFRM